MKATIETLETVKLPFAEVTPTIWRDGDMCGLAHVQITHTCPLAWWLGAIARAM